LRFQLPYVVKKSAITQGKAVSASSASCPKTVTALSGSLKFEEQAEFIRSEKIYCVYACFTETFV